MNYGQDIKYRENKFNEMKIEDIFQKFEDLHEKLVELGMKGSKNKFRNMKKY